MRQCILETGIWTIIATFKVLETISLESSWEVRNWRGKRPSTGEMAPTRLSAEIIGIQCASDHRRGGHDVASGITSSIDLFRSIGSHSVLVMEEESHPILYARRRVKSVAARANATLTPSSGGSYLL
jgi:hypothetical protein